MRSRQLVTNSVFLDLVLESSKTNAQQLGGIFSMVRDFLQGSLNDLSFDLLNGCSQGNYHGPYIVFANLDFFRKMRGLNRSILHRDDQPLHEIS